LPWGALRPSRHCFWLGPEPVRVLDLFPDALSLLPYPLLEFASALLRNNLRVAGAITVEAVPAEEALKSH
jgi:hypothetical protein